MNNDWQRGYEAGFAEAQRLRQIEILAILRRIAKLARHHDKRAIEYKDNDRLELVHRCSAQSLRWMTRRILDSNKIKWWK